MAVFIELVSDAFEETFQNQQLNAHTYGSRVEGGSSVARRPTRGLEIKEDTHASIKVILSDGSELKLVDSSGSSGVSSSGYSNFILQSVSEARMEKHQIVETFGAPYIFFFGENPRFLDVTAIIINSHDFNWEAEWWENYNENFRGTKLVEKGGRLYMFYDDNIVEGYMLLCNANKTSDQPHLIQMSFRLFLTNYRNISFIGDTHFPIRGNAIILEGADPSATDSSPDQQDATTRAASSGSPATAPRLSELLLAPHRQGAVDPANQAQLQRLGVQPSSTFNRALPLRGLITDNLDEYVGLAPNSVAGGARSTPRGGPTRSARPGSPASLPPAAEEKLEVDDLHQAIVRQLEALGIDVDSHVTFSGLGVLPNFDSHARSSATFRPKEKGGFNFSTGGEVTGDDILNPTSRFRQDPLGAIFGDGVSTSTTSRSSDGLTETSSFTSGPGFVQYGYRSSYSSGPGFGETGYGDFGGPGYGSCQGAQGDPGFKDPSRFTFSGVTKFKAAFSKFNQRRPDQSSFGRGAGIASSSSGLSGGASVRVGGKVSAFSLISAPGRLRIGR